MIKEAARRSLLDFGLERSQAVYWHEAIKRQSRLLAYALPTLLAVVAVQTWFTPGTVIATGDLPPPVAPDSQYRSYWNDFTAGEGSPSFEVVALPYFEGLRLSSWLGLGPEVFQRLWLSGLFAGSAAAVVFYAFGLLRLPVAAGFAGLLATFNAYRLVQGANSVSLAAVIVAAVLGGLILRAGLRRGRAPTPLAFAVLSTGLGFVFANPPELALVVVWLASSLVLVMVVGGWAAARAAATFVALALPLVVILNAWWIVPAAATILGPDFGDRFAAAGYEGWAWTHARGSLVNALSLNTAWGWHYPEYFPFAVQLERAPIELLRYFPLVLALLGVALARPNERRLVITLVFLGVAGIWIAKGLHSPLSGVNRWMYEYLPGFWLLRDPAKILGLVGLVFALLGGLAVARLIEARRVPTSLRFGVVVVAVTGALAYVYPLFTGEVIPDRRPLLPSAHVTVPAEWREASTFLNESTGRGKVLVLPRGDFYQLPTAWGYYGVSFTRLAIHRPVLEPSPGGYFRSSDALTDLLASIESELLEGSGRGIRKKLDVLGVRYILLRGDLDRDFAGREIQDPRALTAGLAAVRGLEHVRSFGALDIYEVADSSGGEVEAALPAAFAGDRALIPSALAALPPWAALVTEGRDGESVVRSAGGPVELFQLGHRLPWLVWARAADDRLDLRLFTPIRMRLDGYPLPSAAPLPLRFRNVSPPAVVSIGNTRFVVGGRSRGWTRLGMVNVNQAAVVRVWRDEHTRWLDLEAAGPVRDCNRYDDRTPEEVGLLASVVRRDELPILRLAAQDHSACVSFPITPFDPDGLYRIAFAYRGVEGSVPRVCLWEEGAERCALLPSLDASPGWHQFETTVSPSPETIGLRLYFYADGSGEGTTKSQYRQVEMGFHRLAVKRSLRNTELVRLGPFTLPAGELKLSSTEPTPSDTSIDLQAAGPVRDCNRYDDRTPEEVGLLASVVRRDELPILRLAAQDHSACVSFPITPFDPDGLYRIAFAYRGVEGSVPRVCLWEEGAERCALLPSLDASPGWHQFETTVSPSPETIGLRLYFYADGAEGGGTVTEYRDARVVPASAAALIGIPVSRGLPRIDYRRTSPDEFRVDVIGAKEPFLLTVSEAYASGWHIEPTTGQPAEEALHVRVNGYSNGWFVPWKGTYELRVYYRPERLARAARVASLIALIATLGWLLGRRARGVLRNRGLGWWYPRYVSRRGWLLVRSGRRAQP